MTSVLRHTSDPKSQMSVAPIQWLPGSLSASLPFFAVTSNRPNRLYLRADDPNIYGIGNGTLAQNPQIIKLPSPNPIKFPGGKISANKGCNFYSAPWCIPTFGSRDTGKQVQIHEIDSSVYSYITALYSLVGSTVTITLTDWKLEQEGTVKLYQVLQGSRYTTINSIPYFGGTGKLNTKVSGVGTTTLVESPIISDDFTYSSDTVTLPTYQLPYNTFYAVDTPIIISAIDSTHPTNGRIYFTLQNNVTLYNSPS